MWCMSRLNISFLGTFQVTFANQPITRFRSKNNQGLFAYLLLHHENPITREALTTLFWPNDADHNARNNLRQALYQLRKMLGDLENNQEPYLLVTRQTVQFNAIADYQLDMQQFLASIDAGDLETAVSHYKGELLPAFTCDSLEFESWLRQKREQLHNLALETMAELTRDHLQNGRFDKAQTIAQQQITLEAWREQAHRQLMRAYTLAGDRNKALNQYELCSNILAEELAITPSPETVTLFEDIKAGRYGALISDEALSPPRKVEHNLPADLTPFIGRELERGQIQHHFAQEKHRLVTIVGPGGMGKTRLAITLGKDMLSQFQDGIYFVDLSPLANPDEIPLAIASTLEYEAPDKSKELFQQLLKAIKTENLLLILDNFEHLLAGATLINSLLQTCPEIYVLVTSRQRLNLATEYRFELGGLDFPTELTPENAMAYTAVQLFVENGRHLQSDFAVTDENLAEIIQICQLVQGMPLGLVLAASWLEMLTPAEISAEIKNSLEFLSSELADLPPRQRSMHAVFDYSWQMLSPAEQKICANLTVFRGGFTREAATQVADANLRVLLNLVNKTFLQRDPENGRFSMHELLRQFAAAQRQLLDSEDQAALRHCQYFTQMVKTSVRQSLAFYPLLVPIQHGAERDNLHRAWDYALAHGLAEELAGMARGVTHFATLQGQQTRKIVIEAIERLQKQGIPTTDESLLHLQLIELHTRQEVEIHDRVRELFISFMPFLEEHGSPELRTWFYILSSELWIRSPNPEALTWIDKAIQVANNIDDEIFAHMATAQQLLTKALYELIDETTLTQLKKHIIILSCALQAAMPSISLCGHLGFNIKQTNLMTKPFITSSVRLI